MEFLVFGSLLFWIIAAIFSVIVLASVEGDNPFTFFGFIFGFLAVLQFASDAHPVNYVLHNPFWTLAIVAGYVAVGVGWAIIKWISHVYALRDRYADFRRDLIVEWRNNQASNGRNGQSYVDANGTLTTDGETVALGRASQQFNTPVPANIAKQKSLFTMWMIAWPLSAVWTLINDPVRRFYRFVYYRLSGTLQAISDKAFADYVKK